MLAFGRRSVRRLLVQLCGGSGFSWRTWACSCDDHLLLAKARGRESWTGLPTLRDADIIHGVGETRQRDIETNDPTFLRLIAFIYCVTRKVGGPGSTARQRLHQKILIIIVYYLFASATTPQTRQPANLYPSMPTGCPALGITCELDVVMHRLTRRIDASGVVVSTHLAVTDPPSNLPVQRPPPTFLPAS